MVEYCRARASKGKASKGKPGKGAGQGQALPVHVSDGREADGACPGGALSN